MTMLTRRSLIMAGGGFLAGFGLARPSAGASGTINVTMRGKADGSHVWFDPVGLHILPGQTVRWTNRDAGNSHTVTAYHPDVMARPRRIPEGASPWNSDYLLPDERFSVTFAQEGVYDYYCIPHEHAGMVGRIVVGNPSDVPQASEGDGLTPLPDVALRAFPEVSAIIARRFVRARG